jgi:hypothetical protein
MSKHTPGPWKWRINRATKRIYLVARGYTVMDFVRYGMSCAAPRFLDSEHLMVRADDLAVNIPGEDHHANWNQDIDHPDARLIAAAPALLEALKKALNESGCDGDLCCHEWHDVARAAISKAEGGDA